MLLPNSSRHTFEGDTAFSEVPGGEPRYQRKGKIILSLNEHIAPSVRACRGSIYRTRNDGRHKCRAYKD